MDLIDLGDEILARGPELFADEVAGTPAVEVLVEVAKITLKLVNSQSVEVILSHDYSFIKSPPKGTEVINER
jgi:hypothetical protein